MVCRLGSTGRGKGGVHTFLILVLSLDDCTKAQKGGSSARERKSSSAWTYASRVWTLPFLLNLGKLTEVANKMRRGHRRVLCESKAMSPHAQRVLMFPAIH